MNRSDNVIGLGSKTGTERPLMAAQFSPLLLLSLKEEDRIGPRPGFQRVLTYKSSMRKKYGLEPSLSKLVQTTGLVIVEQRAQ